MAGLFRHLLDKVRGKISGGWRNKNNDANGTSVVPFRVPLKSSHLFVSHRALNVTEEYRTLSVAEGHGVATSSTGNSYSPSYC